jgi:hypothetical protein
MKLTTNKEIVFEGLEIENFYLKRRHFTGAPGDLEPHSFAPATKCPFFRQSLLFASSLLLHLFFFLYIDNGSAPRTTNTLYNDPIRRTPSQLFFSVHSLFYSKFCGHYSFNEHYSLAHFFWTLPQILLAPVISSPLLPLH